MSLDPPHPGILGGGLSAGLGLSIDAAAKRSPAQDILPMHMESRMSLEISSVEVDTPDQWAGLSPPPEQVFTPAITDPSAVNANELHLMDVDEIDTLPRADVFDSMICPNLSDGFRYHRLRKTMLGRVCLYFVVMILSIAWTFSMLGMISDYWVVERGVDERSNSGLFQWNFSTEFVDLPTVSSATSVHYIVYTGQTFAILSTVLLLLIIICLLLIACVPRLRSYSFIPFLGWTSLGLSCLFHILTLLVFHTNYAHKCTYSYDSTTPFHYKRQHSIADKCMWSRRIEARPTNIEDFDTDVARLKYIWTFKYVLGYGYVFYVTGLGLILVSMAILFKFVFVIPNFDVAPKKSRGTTASEEDLLVDMPGAARSHRL